VNSSDGAFARIGIGGFRVVGLLVLLCDGNAWGRGKQDDSDEPTDFQKRPGTGEMRSSSNDPHRIIQTPWAQRATRLNSSRFLELLFAVIVHRRGHRATARTFPDSVDFFPVF
jgi:hypothetical protein